MMFKFSPPNVKLANQPTACEVNISVVSGQLGIFICQWIKFRQPHFPFRWELRGFGVKSGRGWHVCTVSTSDEPSLDSTSNSRTSASIIVRSYVGKDVFKILLPWVDASFIERGKAMEES